MRNCLAAVAAAAAGAAALTWAHVLRRAQVRYDVSRPSGRQVALLQTRPLANGLGSMVPHEPPKPQRRADRLLLTG